MSTIKTSEGINHNRRRFCGTAAMTIASDFDGAAADGTSYAKKSSGKYSHRIFKGIGHNVQQEAPQDFAKAIVDVDGY
jgi:pimeloyl-ACP methyl ester carboxylesterase